ncbi:hypothetical protein EYF80_039063 [Liparis tanakae]|uniref:Uncharacterized protein n=1 Tax=Liparis tanakae TaxID=230148 RepID=A0A4Z2GDJ6_9TELE|nr:hypothetical protein EYF80_039063 [Liparis tanakae]
MRCPSVARSGLRQCARSAPTCAEKESTESPQNEETHPLPEEAPRGNIRPRGAGSDGRAQDEPPRRRETGRGRAHPLGAAEVRRELREVRGASRATWRHNPPRGRHHAHHVTSGLRFII